MRFQKILCSKTKLYGYEVLNPVKSYEEDFNNVKVILNGLPYFPLLTDFDKIKLSDGIRYYQDKGIQNKETIKALLRNANCIFYKTNGNFIFKLPKDKDTWQEVFNLKSNNGSILTKTEIFLLDLALKITCNGNFEEEEKRLFDKPYYHINVFPKTLILYQDEFSKLEIPDNVIFELVERNSSLSIEELNKVITGLNLKISLDDFGTGSSNFDRLELENIVSIKIERTLWKDKPAITDKIVQELKERNILTIAEKVETDDDFNLVKKLEFNLFQGFYFI